MGTLDNVNIIIRKIDFSEMRDKRVLLTGATGLFGSYFISLFNELNVAGVPLHLDIVHLHDIPQHLLFVKDLRWINCIRMDLCNDEELKKMGNYDYILHFAGYGQPDMFSQDQIKTIKLNTTVTMTLLDHLNNGGKFLFASTSGIYNGLIKDSYTEEDVGTTNTLHPRACYYEGKRCGEVIVNAYRARGVHASSARISYTYGPGVRKTDNRALYSFIKKGLESHRIEMLDDGSVGRIYCYVTDAVEMLMQILLNGTEPIYNVGGIEKTTIRSIAEYVGRFTGADVIVPKNVRSVIGNAPVERLDMTKTLSQFPIDYVPLEVGIKKTIDWWIETYEVNA